jgi:hypothetical protein
MTASHIVPLEVLPPWSGPADTVLGAHIGTTDYLLPPRAHDKFELPASVYTKNEDFWHDPA